MEQEVQEAAGGKVQRGRKCDKVQVWLVDWLVGLKESIPELMNESAREILRFCCC